MRLRYYNKETNNIYKFTSNIYTFITIKKCASLSIRNAIFYFIVVVIAVYNSIISSIFRNKLSPTNDICLHKQQNKKKIIIIQKLNAFLKMQGAILAICLLLFSNTCLKIEYGLFKTTFLNLFQ